jgi:hypothetical protein
VEDSGRNDEPDGNTFGVAAFNRVGFGVEGEAELHRALADLKRIPKHDGERK